MTINKSENLSSKEEMEANQKNLVEDPQVMSQLVDLQHSAEIELKKIELFIPLDIYNFFDSIIKLCKWNVPSAEALFQQDLLDSVEANLDCFFGTMPGFNTLKTIILSKIKQTKEVLQEVHDAEHLMESKFQHGR